MKKILIAIAALMSTAMADAKIWMPSVFSDGMVLQQQSDCKLWGTATPGSVVKVTVSWNGEKKYVTAAADGKWSMAVATPEASYTQQTLTVTEEKPNGKKAAVTDNVRMEVLIGEVWLCAGQSNMDMPMKGYPSQPIENGLIDILHSKDASLHLFKQKLISSVEPLDSTVGEWKAACPANTREFSATAYYFGRELRRILDVPVGLIVTAWGGSSCESWMDRATVRPFVTAKSPYQIPDTPQDVKSKNRQPTVLFNGMLHPFIGYGIRGAIWYQGEDNAPRYEDYAQQMNAMVGLWRNKWGRGEFPFYYCQIAPYDYSLIGWNVNTALLREQQYIAEQLIPNAGMAVLMDAGIKKGIHPPKKNLAGERLAILALGKTYGVGGFTPQSARYKEVRFEGDKAILSFENDKMNLYGKNSSFTSNLFEIAGEDRVFYPATVEIYKRKFLSVSSDKVPVPVAVRYAFHNWVDGDLYCEDLPLSSFRTDDWPVGPDGPAPAKAEDYDKR